MKKVLLMTLTSIAIAAHTISLRAEGNPMTDQTTSNSSAMAELFHEIGVAEWSLRFSSVAKGIPSSVLDSSLLTLDKARQEFKTGNIRTARELTRKASIPLTAMAGTALSGKHPDKFLHLLQIRQTLVSITDSAEGIANEKSASMDFVKAARQTLTEIDALLSSNRTDEAKARLEQSYLEVQQRIAELRRGDTFYISAPSGLTVADWLDGLRRVEDRRQITRYLVIEASSDGVDHALMQEGIRSAEMSVAKATKLARDERWEPALQTLELAYAQYEQSWRAVGIDW